MSKIDFTMDNTAKIAVSEINADATTSTGSSNAMTFAGVIVSQKGKPFEAIQVTKQNFKEKLGEFFHSSIGKHADAMRTLDEALDGGNGVVVRIVPAAATRPVIKVSKPDAELVIINEALNYKSDLQLEEGEFLALAIKDGANSDNRKCSLEAADPALYGSNMFILTLTETLAAGGESILEELFVSFDLLATDSMGAPAYIETVLENSAYLECLCEPEAAKREIQAIPETAFTGASNGDMNTIVSADYDEAIKVLRTTNHSFNFIVGLSCYDDAVTKLLQGIANDKRISGAYDIDPRLTHPKGLEHKNSLSLNDKRAGYTHLPFTAKCPTYKNMCVWGASGIAFRAKALGVAKTSPTGGWHYTGAGFERATITRTALTPIKNVGEPDYPAMYKARLNKIGVTDKGTLFIDDSLTCHLQENYLRFEQVVSICDAVSRDFHRLANEIKHNPDDVTYQGIYDGMKEILEGYESVGALVKPRNPDVDGEEAWRLTVTQVEIDYWKVSYSLCPSGSGRRMLGEPILIK